MPDKQKKESLHAAPDAEGVPNNKVNNQPTKYDANEYTTAADRKTPYLPDSDLIEKGNINE
jgi:hypothetical protein